MAELFPDSDLRSHAEARAENGLLLLCAHRGDAASVAARRREVAARVSDLEYLYRLAHRHALLPLLHRGLEGLEGVPEGLSRRLRDDYRKNGTRNVLLAGELARVSKALKAEGVGALAYKGPALALQAYGDLRLRRFVDLDVVVRREDARRAGEVLGSLGYAKPEGLTESHEQFLLRHQHALAYTRDRGLLMVELHWEVAPAHFAAYALGEGVWARDAAVELYGSPVRCLSTEDLLVALAVHGTKHLWERLAWLCDVAALVNSHPELDWPLVRRLAREARVERMVNLALRLARGLLGAKLPEDILAELDDGVLKGLSAEVASAMFAGSEYVPVGLVRNARFNMRARARMRERLDYLRFILTPTDGDLTALRLPAWMSFAYYLLRPLRLAFKGEAAH